MKVTLTSMAGNTRNINLSTKQEVYDFIDLFKSTLLPSQRIKITCDLLGLDGYVQGENKIQRVLLAIILRVPVQIIQRVLLHKKILQCAHYFFRFIYFYICIIHLRKIFRFWLFWFYKIFQIWGIIDGMGILENFENAWDPEFQYEHTNPIKIYSDTCCNGCTCQTSDAHKPEN